MFHRRARQGGLCGRGPRNPSWVVAPAEAGFAELRARAFLAEKLSTLQLAQLEWDGFFDVASPNDPMRLYRIRESLGRIEVYDEDGLIDELCVTVAAKVPRSDALLTFFLYIQGDEAGFLRTATHFPSNRRFPSV